MTWSWQGRRIPLSWMLLTRQPVRLLVALAGISFAGILMFMQLGFRDGLFDASVTVHRLFDADLVLISPRSASSVRMAGFPRRRLIQTLADPSVDGVTPVHWGLMLWRNPETRRNRAILALGFNPDDPFFLDPGLAEQTGVLKQKGRILFDQLSRPEFGPIADWYNNGKVVETEISGNRVRVEGLVSLGTSFGADGNLLTSTETFLDLMPQKSPGGIEVGLIRLKPGTNPELAVERLQQRLPDDVTVLTKQGFIDFEQNYWKSSTSIGFIFTLGAAMGFVVGCVIVYQVLSTDVSDHMREYATFKAMGYSHRFFLGIVLEEALILGILGFVPGILVGTTILKGMAMATTLPLQMTFGMAVSVFIGTVIACALSGAIATRRLVGADPADLF